MRGKIIYEDAAVLVVYKPAGFPVQTAGVGQPDLVSELKNYLQGAYLGVVHRLDQPVEGLLVFAKTKAAAGELSKQLQAGILKKQYLAVVYGRPTTSRAELTDYMYKTPDNRAQIVAAESKDSHGTAHSSRADVKKAVLRYQVKGEGAAPRPDGTQLTMLEVEIETGRFHQIRAQLSHAGLPILGDEKYGSEASKQLGRELGVKYVALCAAGISFRNPVKKKEMSFQIPPENPAFQQMRIE